MSVNSFNDSVSVIDLNQDGRYTSMSSGSQTHKSNHYHISLHSIDDDELKLFHRDLVTPAPSVYDDDLFSRNMVRTRFGPTYPRPASRTESVMLFKKINNGDEDVSFDLVSSEFLDTDFMMDGMLSRPVSRTTISNNASKIQDINKFRNTFQKKDDLLQQQMKKCSLTTMNPSSNPPLMKSEYNRSAPNKAIHQQRSPNRIIEPKYNTRDEYLYKQIPKRLITNREKPTTYYNTKRQLETVPAIEHRHLNPIYVKSFVPEPEEQSTPRMTRKTGGAFSNYRNTPKSDRNRSDTTSSSSSEELYEEEPLFTNRTSQLLHHNKNDYNTETKTLDFQNYSAIPSGHYSSPILHHRYSVPNNRFLQGEHQEVEYKSLSSRISKRTDKNISVTDSAKQVLACIRERRKSAMILDNSPKLEGRTRFISSSLTSQQQDNSSDFRSRLQIHRESTLNRSPGNKYLSSTASGARRYEEMQGNDNRLTSRLPQRTIYR